MNHKNNFWAVMAVVLLFLSGCATTPDSVVPVAKVMHMGPETNRTAQVLAGNMMMQIQTGEHFTAYQLDETVRTSILGNSCTVAPQLFVKTRQDDDFYYGISGRDYVKPSPLNWQQKDYLRTRPCGVKFTKKDLKVVEVVFEHKNGAIDKMGPVSIEGNARPFLKPVPMINIYSPAFLRKTLKFDSYSDGFLSLRFMDERGKPSGYDARGNMVGVPPEVTERMYEFDLQTSKTIEVQGARIDIIDARPDKLVYKVIRQMSAD